MARNLNIRNTIISLVILILLVFLGLGAIKVFNQTKGAIKVDAQAKFEHPDDEVEALREIDPCSEDPNWKTPSIQDGPLYNSSLICNCCYPGVVKCHVVHKLLVKGDDFCGKIPPSLATLPYLEAADFTQNDLSGGIPPEWTSMKNLNYLSLYANNLSGPIPIYLGNMITPVYVRLDNSMFCGTVPPELAKLFNVEHLILAASCRARFNGGFNSVVLASYSSSEYDKLALQYPPNACSTKYENKCIPNSCLPQGFTIHGLWPNNNTPPVEIITFNITFLEDVGLLKYLDDYWPNVMQGWTNKCFWKYEWKKHGPYYRVGSENSTSTTLVEFFNRTINLFRKPWINQTLNELLKKPNGKTYKTADILNQVKERTKFTPELQCWGKNSKNFLIEIRFCLGTKLESLKDCPRELSEKSCKIEFYIKK